MTSHPADKAFTGSIPKLYETYLVPLIFVPYATDLAARIAALRPGRVLEIAAGTGVVTRAMAAALPPQTSIVATDLNAAMIEHASALGASRPVEWRQADAMTLPFDDGTFDAVVCQFGAMFFPDRPKAYAEARRVLRPGGTLLFNVWDRIEDNEFTACVQSAMEAAFPQDPPRFLARVPHGYFDTARLRDDVAQGGFGERADIATVTARSRADSPRVPAIGFCQGSPLRNEIESRDASRMSDAVDLATEAVARRFGSAAIDGKIQAHVVSARK
jgi:SAM-dependent methyltransferase